MNNELIKQIDEERYAYRLYGFDGSSTDLVLADCKAEIERLETELEQLRTAKGLKENQVLLDALKTLADEEWRDDDDEILIDARTKARVAIAMCEENQDGN